MNIEEQLCPHDMMQFTLTQFDGPLDLLLGLIQEKKLEITELAISEVTEQYIKYIDTLDEANPSELSDFLVMATKLLLLKSRQLLPQFSLTEEEDETSLKDQLTRYKAFVDASKKLNAQWLAPHKSVFRIESPRKPEGFVPPQNATVEQLHSRMQQLVKRLAPPKPLPKTHIDKTISMKEKILAIQVILQKQKKIYFFEVIDQKQNRTELIVSFLALLELVKQRTISLTQDSLYGDIAIESIA